MTGFLKHFIFSSAMIAGLSACNKAPVEATAKPDTSSTADAIYVGGPIVTINDAQPMAEALAIKDGKILAVGTQNRD